MNVPSVPIFPEQHTTVGLRVGGDGPVNDVTIIGVTSGPTPATRSSGHFCTGDGTTNTSTATVIIDNKTAQGGHTVKNTTLISTSDPPNSNQQAGIIIHDCVHGDISFGSSNHAVAQYTLGQTGERYFNTAGSVNQVTSAVLDAMLGPVQQYSCSGGGSATLSTANLQPGDILEFVFVQAPVGSPACTIVYPSNVHGATTVSATLGSVTTQKFIVSNGGTDLYAVAAAAICTPGVPSGTTCGTP